MSGARKEPQAQLAAPQHIDTKNVDFEAVSRWMDEQGLPRGEVTAVSPLPGGTQNIMVRFCRGGREYVLRRPPKHLRDVSNNVIRREARLLGALRGQGVPAPELIAACADETVLGGAVFYLMEPVEGFNASASLPQLHAGSTEIRHQMGLEAVNGIAALGALDYRTLGLDGYGNPDGFLERQVPRWLKELDSYSRHDGYPGPDLPGLDSVTNWLERHRPSQWKPGIMHGDFHLANMMFCNDGPQLAAIVDWEMSTIGDPLLDLGWLLATWPSEADDACLGGALAEAGGLPTPEELVAHYAKHTDRDLGAMDWYTVLACFKLGIILEGTYARAFAGKAPVAVGDYLHGLTLQLFRRAAAISG